MCCVTVIIMNHSITFAFDLACRNQHARENDPESFQHSQLPPLAHLAPPGPNRASCRGRQRGFGGDPAATPECYDCWGRKMLKHVAFKAAPVSGRSNYSQNGTVEKRCKLREVVWTCDVTGGCKGFSSSWCLGTQLAGLLTCAFSVQVNVSQLVAACALQFDDVWSGSDLG